MNIVSANLPEQNYLSSEEAKIGEDPWKRTN